MPYVLWVACLLLAAIATFLLVVYWFQRRDLLAIRRLARELQTIAMGGSLQSRVQLRTDQPEVNALATSVNHLLGRVAGAQERDRSAPRLFAELGDRIHEVVLLHSGDGIVYANRQFAQLVGVERMELIGRKLEDLVAPEYAELVADNIRRRLADEPAAERYEIEIVGLQGQLSKLEISSTILEYEGRRALLINGIEEVTTQNLPQLRTEIAPVASEAPAVVASQIHARALEALGEAVITTDAEGGIEYANPTAERLIGTTLAAMRGRKLEQVVTVAKETELRLIVDPIKQALAGAATVMSRRAISLMHEGGIERAVEFSAAPLRQESGVAESAVTGAVIVLRDVTELRGVSKQLSYQATHDPLTGLTNRSEFERRVQVAIESAQTGSGGHVLCYLDLDHFKVVNDTSGHLAGDSMLRDVARLLREAVRDSDTVARLGGDEFGMLLVGCPLEKARQIADDVCRSVADYRFVWKDKIFHVGVSVGLVELGRESGSVEELLTAADSACYVAKKQGTGKVSVYSARDEAMARQSGEIHWLQKLQAALKEGGFELHVQPIQALHGEVGGPALEVLVRLDDAGTKVPPREFLRAAERYRLMNLVDRWVVENALLALSRGEIPLPPSRSMTLNVSGQTLTDAQFLEFVVECFDRTGVAPSQVCFEISENTVAANLSDARRFIGVLHGIGCQFALDNFGSGLGSFASLKSLSMDYLKIDGALTRNLAKDSVGQTMVAAIVKLARTMNFRVIAEQVEDEASAEAARRMGVDYLQGYVIARPAPLALAA